MSGDATAFVDGPYARVLPFHGERVPDRDPLVDRRDALISGADVADLPRDSARRRLLAFADIAAIIASYAAVWAIAPPTEGSLVDRLPLAMVLPLWVLLNKMLGLYDRDDKLIHKSTLEELPKIVHSITIGTMLVFMFGDYLMPVETSRGPAIMFAVIAIITVPSARAMVRAYVRHRFPPERCLIVGSGSVAGIVARKIVSHPEYGVEVIGCLDDVRGARRRGTPMGLPMLGTVDDFPTICRTHEIERVVVAFSALSHEQTLDVIRAAKRARIKITIVPRLFEVIGHSVVVDEVEGMTVLSLRGLTRSRSTLLLKRTIDIVASGVGLLLLAPIMALIALAIKLTSPGPVLYRQRRTGKTREFTMYKFRSMVVNADEMKPALAHLNEATGPMFKIARDPRVTRVGQWLRRTSLDELPQLWNVLRGEMSLVGPRPLIPDEDDHIIGWHRARLELTPGLTGPWQVAGRTAVPFDEMVKMDYLYVAEWSLWNDIRLLLRTAPVVLLGRGH